MTREEKILMAIDKGYTCDEITGEVFNKNNKLITRRKNSYIVIGFRDIDRKFYEISSHQFIYYWVHKKCVDCIDHINGFKDDNRIINLRSVTHQQNGFNTNAKGYCFHKNKWKSKIVIDGEHKHLGYFSTEVEARQAYLNAKSIYHNIT